MRKKEHAWTRSFATTGGMSRDVEGCREGCKKSRRNSRGDAFSAARGIIIPPPLRGVSAVNRKGFQSLPAFPSAPFSSFVVQG